MAFLYWFVNVVTDPFLLLFGFLAFVQTIRAWDHTTKPNRMLRMKAH
jgi:hypothetical protein